MTNLDAQRKQFIRTAKALRAAVETHVQGTPFAVTASAAAKDKLVTLVEGFGYPCHVDELIPGYFHVEPLEPENN